MAQQIQLRNGTALEWTNENPLLAAGEWGYELDSGFHKVGDGVTLWNSLAYKGLPGPTGPQGIQGEQGIQGAQGIQGEQGLPGFQAYNNFSFFTHFMLLVATGGALITEGMNFQALNGGTGSGPSITNSDVDSTKKKLGVLRHQSGTTGTSFSAFFAYVGSLLFGYCKLVAIASARFEVLGTVTEGFEWTFGFGDNNGATEDHTDGAYFRHNANGVNTNIECVTSSNSVRTSTITSHVVSTSAYSEYKVEVKEDGSQVDFYIDGVIVATHTTNIPTGSGRQCGFMAKIFKNLGTASRNVLYDYCSFSGVSTLM